VDEVTVQCTKQFVETLLRSDELRTG